MTEVAPKRRGRPKKDDDPAPEERVLAEALHAFAVHGYQGVSVRDLNRVLGVSHNLLHRRFGSKEGVWYAAVNWGYGGLVAEMIRGDDPDADPESRMRTMIRAFVSFSARHPDLARLMTSEAGRQSPRLEYLVDIFVRPLVDRFTPVFDELIRSGRWREVPVHTFYYLVTSGSGAPFSHMAMTQQLFGAAPFTEEQIERHAQAVADVVIDGMRPPGRDDVP